MNSILVVEDERSLELLYQQELSQEGYHVFSTSTGEDALSILDKENIDLVILDLKLPQMSGLELLGRMLTKKRDMKVVINTAFANYKSDFTCWLADDYVIKSSDLSELKSTVRKHIH